MSEQPEATPADAGGSPPDLSRTDRDDRDHHPACPGCRCPELAAGRGVEVRSGSSTEAALRLALVAEFTRSCRLVGDLHAVLLQVGEGGGPYRDFRFTA